MKKTSSKQPSARQLKVGEEIRHVLAEVIARGNLHHPALTNKIISITEVRISPDLRNATAFVMPLGGENIDGVLEGLEKCVGYFKREINSKMRLKFTPEIRFLSDNSFKEYDVIESLLRTPDVARDLKVGSSNES